MSAHPLPSIEGNRIVLDDGIRQQFFAHGIEAGLGAIPVLALNLDIEDLALAHRGEALEAEIAAGALDGLALGVENAGLERDGDARLDHWMSLSLE